MRFPEPEERRCDVPGCTTTGEYRAPRSRDDLTSYFWFCLGHVREYNSSWNYYAGISQTDMENQIRSDVTWWRPTWPLGARSAFYNQAAGAAPYVNFGAFAAQDWLHKARRPNDGRTQDSAAMRPRHGSAQARALAVFDLDPPVTQAEIKARYKSLVKRHHPDANGGAKDAEERLKLINEAYATLKLGVVV